MSKLIKSIAYSYKSVVFVDGEKRKVSLISNCPVLLETQLRTCGPKKVKIKKIGTGGALVST